MNLRQMFLSMLGRKEAPEEASSSKVQAAPLKLLYEYTAEGAGHMDLMTLRNLAYLSERDAVDLLQTRTEEPWLRLVQKRIKENGCTRYIDPRIYCMILPDLDRPAIAVLWAYTLFRMAERPENMEGLALGDFMHDFYMGLPSMNSYEQAWRDQKAGPVNLLDTPEQWQ